MKEYAIYRRNNGGKPFMLDVYKDNISAKIRINELVSYWEERGYQYYIDNDYYNNKYPLILNNCFYCSIKVREVSEWCNYSEDKKDIKNNSNIIFFDNFKKSIDI